MQHAEAKRSVTSLTGEAAPEKISSGSGCREPLVIVTFLIDIGGVGSERIGHPLSKGKSHFYLPEL